MNEQFSYINGLRVYAFKSKEELINYAIDKKKILVAINAEKILNSDNKLESIVNNNIGYTDGIGAVWALKRKGIGKVEKIPGCEIWLDIISKYYNNKSFYLVGAKENVITETVKKLKEEFPNINILNYRNGYIQSKDEKKELFNDIKKKNPDVVFVAAGSPKQEFLMKELLDLHKALYAGLGGSFDIYVNNIKRAPKIYRSLNLEWFYRLLIQPARIKRQIIYIKLLIMILLKKL